jgi:hypothetical protein
MSVGFVFPPIPSLLDVIVTHEKRQFQLYVVTGFELKTQPIHVIVNAGKNLVKCLQRHAYLMLQNSPVPLCANVHLAGTFRQHVN